MMAGWHNMFTLVGVYAQLSGIFSQNCTTGSGQCLTVCDPGNYINTTNNVCVQCELGFYQDQNNATSCKSCGNGRITLIKGSPSYLYCVEPCSAGRYHTGIVNTSSCVECPVGQYQNAPDQLSCLVCPLGRTTYLTGSALCYDICNAGSFFNTTLVSCQLCPAGQYQPDRGRAECFICPQGFVSSTGSTQCKVFCSAGQRIDNVTSQCVPCEIGTYQPETSQTSCISCGSPENWITNRNGSTSISDCSFFCPSGYNKSGINSCESCPIGTFKDSAIDRFGSCQPCPPNSTTNGTRTTSIDFCNIYLCSHGTFWNLNQSRCQPCERGTYQPDPGLTSCIPCESSKTTNTTGAIYASQCIFYCQRGYSHNSSTDMCDPCPVGFYQDVFDQMFCKMCGFAHTTLYQASTSINDCIEICVSGTQYTTTGRCEPCLKGTYRTAGIGTLACQNCPNGFTTIGTGTPLISGCNIAACYQGTYRTINNICEACPLGTYQPDWYQESCSSCGPATNWFTEQVGSVTKDQCKFFCPSGYVVGSNNTCDICPKDYYKDNTINVFSLCVKCPNNTFTASPGSTSINNCSIAECPAGYQRNATLSGCQPCGVGFYQPSVNQNVCVSCPPNYSTRGLASDSSSDCELYCPSGQVLQNNTCISCERGFYKDNTISPFMMCARCPPNYVTPSTGSTSITNCYVRDCLAGTRRNQNDTGCIDCELGFYQPNPYETSCIQCQLGYSTNTTRSTSITQCNIFCQRGYSHNISTDMCDPCPIGFYQDVVDQMFCKMCGFAHTTLYQASTSINDCIEICVSGTQYTTTGRCEPCLKGTYRTAGVGTLACQNCPNGFTTIGTGTPLISGCNIAACYQGTYRTINNICEACPLGTYQPDWYQESCSSCGPATNWFTEQVGSVTKDQCKFFCPSGYVVGSNNTCDICPKDYYKDNTINVFSLCVKCPNNTFTASPGSTSINNCSIAECPAGYQRNATLSGCQPCGLGFYQPSVNQNVCVSCPPNYSTRGLASDSSSDCELYCPSGQVLQNNTCISCERGFYKDNTISPFMMCTRCPPNYVTPSTGSTSITNCYVRDCLAGTRRNQNDTGCIDCELGFYQPNPYETSCIQCQPGYSTNTTRSTSITQCNRYCPPGTGMINNTNQCTSCPVGFYSETGFSTVCNKCMDGFVTENSGSTSVLDCNIVACEAGSYRDVTTNRCQLCPIGEYQDSKYQTSCKPCRIPGVTLLYKTNHTGSTSVSECIYFCPSGYELRQDGQCFICSVGQYKDNNINIWSMCTVCPDGKVTPGVGAISQSQCTIRDCPAGYFASLIVDRCIPCGFGTYQPKRNQASCMNCPTGTSTKQTGSTSFSECFLYCQSGFEIVPNNVMACQECQQGYYKDNSLGIYSSCIHCPANFTTNRIAAVSSSACNIRICPLGFYINQINQCTLCPKGTYQDQPFQSSCTPCPFGQTTNSSGSFNIMDCYYVLCPPGEQYLNGACQPCEIGYYKAGINADRCQQCSAGVITLSRGSSLPTDCSIPACLAGQYLVSYDSILECRPCPIGTYQDEVWQRYCKRCQTGYITLNTSSISLEACVVECLDGQVRSNKTGLCVPCPIGTYWTMGLNPKCVPCSDGLLTPAAGSITIADCLISPCQKGYMYILNRQQCEICPRGTYQPEDGKMTCNYCPADRFYTSQEGATDVTECRSPCLVGQGFNQNTQQCFDCPVGTYQPIPFSFTCIECPNGRKYTNSTGSIQESDCLSYCGSSSRNECSVNATCTDDSSVPDGYMCVCKMFYTTKESSINLKPGRVCIHECDADFCMNNAVCSKTDSGPICSCNERYKGKRCQERLAAEDVMDDKSKWIIAVVVTVVVLILIIITFIVWFCFRDGFQPCRKPLMTSHYMESHAIVQDNRNYRIPGPKILYAVPKKTALINKQAGNIIFRDGTTMKPEPEIMYDIPRFQRLSRRSGDVSVYET